MAINLYEILNIKPTASTQEIVDAIAEAELSSVDPAMINAAKQFLLDKEKRKKYDLMLNRKPSSNSVPIKEPVKLVQPKFEELSVPSSNIKFCSACGAKLELNQAFCSSCGVKIMTPHGKTQAVPAKSNLPPKKPQRSLLSMMALLSVAGLVFCTVLMLLFSGGGNGTKAKRASADVVDLKSMLYDSNHKAFAVKCGYISYVLEAKCSIDSSPIGAYCGRVLNEMDLTSEEKSEALVNMTIGYSNGEKYKTNVSCSKMEAAIKKL